MKYLRIILVSVYIILVVLLLLLRSCERPDKVIDEEEQVISIPVERAATIGNRGKLKITLLWDFPADLDLHVLEPNGYEIYYKNKQDSVTGGFLDADNREGGEGAAENIFWEEPPKGEYVVVVKYYEAIDEVLKTGICQVVVFKGDESPVVHNVEMTKVKQKVVVARIKI